MRRCLLPLAVLGVLLSLALWNSAAMAGSTARWRDQLLRADQLAQAGDWSGAEDALAESYGSWSAGRTWLRIVAHHDDVDDAESMYRRAMAFAAGREPDEFRAEIADLRDQLRLLAEAERPDIRNIL